MSYRSETTEIILQRLYEPRRFIQVLTGPRQVGKTTIAHQVSDAISVPVHYASADDPALKGRTWIEQQWSIGRELAKNGQAVLILDEAQKLADWDEIVKKLWDEDTATKIRLQVLLLGSSPLLINRGLSESLAGRFEVLPVTHWDFSAMKEAFGYTLEEFIFFGGYPGAAEIRSDLKRWRDYIRNSLLETTISRDVLLVTAVEKPALLRRLFDLGCSYSGRELSYQKMLGQLQDAGNTTTLAHYLHLLEKVGLVSGLEKYAGVNGRRRASSPKLQVFNTALISSVSLKSLEDAMAETDYWGRLVESAIGAHLLNAARTGDFSVFYWRDGKHEVDFVLERESKVVLIEVKSSHRIRKISGMEAFDSHFGSSKKLLVGADGMPISEFLLNNPASYF